MIQLAEVIKSNGNKALVKINRQSACQKCNKDCLLAGNSHEIKEMKVEVDNPIGATAGQTVKLEMGESHLVLASLIIYVLPILGLIGGYFIGSWFGSHFLILSENSAGIAGSFLLFFLVFLIIRLFNFKIEGNEGFHPCITEIIR